ncbi:DNA translocase FtsK [Pseudalkalibacillus sp. SCS-8]|uniref:DNA translocase FtsK n=1 Tax=Pseudalkalibacillus nanhaiensis TaxID=3115291 RepID=UPI0032DB89D4
MNWFKKMMDFIFEDEEGTGKNEGNNQQRKNVKTKEKGKAIGRIQDPKRSFEPKVKHQYPEDGNFRFPLIPDEKKNRDWEREKGEPEWNVKEQPPQTPKSKRENVSYRNDRSEEQRPKFTGVNFKATEIPSPIYGFRQRPESYPPENMSPTSHSSFEPGYETSRVMDHEKYNEVIQDDEWQDHQNEALINVEVSSGNREVEEEYEQENPSLSEHCFEETVADTGDIGDEEVVSNHPSTHLSTDEEGLGYSSEDLEAEEQRTFNQDEKDTYEEEWMETEEESAEGEKEELTVQESKESTTQEPFEKQNDVPMKDRNRPAQSKERKKSSIPFNVMMLQRDRNKKTETDSSKKDPKKTAPPQREERNYTFPSANLLDKDLVETNDDDTWLDEQIELLQSTLDNFNVKANVLGATKGPSVTRIEVQPAPGVKVNKITNLSDDIKLSLAAKDIRMEAPIPGKNAIGIEVPNKVSKPVTLREIITHSSFQQDSSPLSVALGLDISGQPVITDLQKMPHGLIAGATGSGKSVCINSLLISILYKAHPDDVRLLLIDPKMVELAPYNKLPHLVTPVITDAKEATLGLKWAVDEMERRYELFAKSGVRDMERFNRMVKEKGEPEQKLPYIVVVIDELADLMMVSPQEVEDSICRIAQKARACGIHLLLATQRPSVDVITGLIKANIPTRVAFAVSSSVDSRTIIDSNGADKLLGKGDMLFLGNGVSKPVRIQGNFVSDEEIERITEHVKSQKEPDYLFEKEELVQSTLEFDQSDELFDEACEFVLEQGAASSSSLQRRFRIGYNRAARLVDMMEAKGIVSEAMGSKPRNVLITKQEYEEKSTEQIRH